jgi:hypothetical protein
MQLGTRWSIGAEAPRELPDAVRTAIADVEQQLTALDTAAWRWTLTWLERKPVVELDDGTIIRYDPVTDVARVSDPDDPNGDDQTQNSPDED